jgi:hypothetical protein
LQAPSPTLHFAHKIHRSGGVCAQLALDAPIPVDLAVTANASCSYSTTHLMPAVVGHVIGVLIACILLKWAFSFKTTIIISVDALDGLKWSVDTNNF